jgi:hypothetical protein
MTRAVHILKTLNLSPEALATQLQEAEHLVSEWKVGTPLVTQRRTGHLTHAQ